uniref:Uncharacterized protein n=1 Tax=Cacopsylla melanoneura TaxID=428564 RepID=A0A8D9EVD9_9HEMI
MHLSLDSVQVGFGYRIQLGRVQSYDKRLQGCQTGNFCPQKVGDFLGTRKFGDFFVLSRRRFSDTILGCFSRHVKLKPLIGSQIAILKCGFLKFRLWCPFVGRFFVPYTIVF